MRSANETTLHNLHWLSASTEWSLHPGSSALDVHSHLASTWNKGIIARQIPCEKFLQYYLEIYKFFNSCVNFEEKWTAQCKIMSWQTWHCLQCETAPKIDCANLKLTLHYAQSDNPGNHAVTAKWSTPSICSRKRFWNWACFHTDIPVKLWHLEECSHWGHRGRVT